MISVSRSKLNGAHFACEVERRMTRVCCRATAALPRLCMRGIRQPRRMDDMNCMSGLDGLNLHWSELPRLGSSVKPQSIAAMRKCIA
jgi:hypothetical protein